jgi:hypothetical protein
MTIPSPESPPGLPADDNWVPFKGGSTFMGDGTPSADAVPDSYDPTPYVQFVTDLLAAEQARIDRMEARGLAVVTTSGTLATLLLAIAALVVKRQGVHIDKSALALAALASLAFVVAAGLGIAANRPRRAWDVSPGAIAEQMQDRWGRASPRDSPDQKVTATRVEIWKSLRELSQSKAKSVFAAMTVEAMAIALLTAAVFIIAL